MTALVPASKLDETIRLLGLESSATGRFMIVQAVADSYGVHMRKVWDWLRAHSQKQMRKRCIECGEYRRVHRPAHRPDGHPFVDTSPASRAAFEQWAEDYMTDTERRTFVDALRCFLGLRALYKTEERSMVRIYPDPDFSPQKPRRKSS